MYAVDFGTSNSLLSAASARRPARPSRSTPRRPIRQSSEPLVLRAGAVLLRRGGDQRLRRERHAGPLHPLVEIPPRSQLLGTQIGHRVVTIEDLIGRFLRQMREQADRHFDADVARVVLGRPAKFSADPPEDRLAEERLERAARIAGFREVSFCPEPVAALRLPPGLRSRGRRPRRRFRRQDVQSPQSSRMRPEGSRRPACCRSAASRSRGTRSTAASCATRSPATSARRSPTRVPLGSNQLTMPRSIDEALLTGRHDGAPAPRCHSPSSAT